MELPVHETCKKKNLKLKKINHLNMFENLGQIQGYNVKQHKVKKEIMTGARKTYNEMSDTVKVL